MRFASVECGHRLTAGWRAGDIGVGGREIGYLAFTGKQTWQSHPWLPTWAYLSLSALIPALA